MSWIWLNENTYPEYQENFSNTNSISDEAKERFRYCAADFKKRFSFDKKCEKIVMSVSADNYFHLFVNGVFTGMGPALPGGDFLCRRPAPHHYSNAYTVELGTNEFEIFAKVRSLPEKVCDYSRNHCGFMLEGTLYFEDGEKMKILTDESWLCRVDTAYPDYCTYDSSHAQKEYGRAAAIPDIWHAEPAPIDMLAFEKVADEKYNVAAGEKKQFTVDLDKIWGAYPIVAADGACRVHIETSELPGQRTTHEDMNFAKAGEYFSFRMHSVGYAEITLENYGENTVTVSFELLASYYPVREEGSFSCSDEGFNKVYDVCKHTLRICRQTIHLDSPQHQELLACTGDYYIDMLMTLYMFGDMKLSEFDVIRTADWITANGGRMFHTTYSLIWVQMLRDCYLFTGKKELLSVCEAALDSLFTRFDSYFGDSGVIEYPPDFMFVDWTVVDGYSMHHPPKALGQTVLNAFYYAALEAALKIYTSLGRERKIDEFKARAEVFRENFNREFYDPEKQMYFDGKNDAYGGFAVYLPDNSSKRYYTKYPNILACAYGLAYETDAAELLERMICSEDMQDIQPYFMSYMLKAVRKNGLFGKYGMKLLERWKPVVEECDKGLKEGWIAPQPDYSFDHSHSWGGIVGYMLPSAILNMRILEPGMKKLSFSPDLHGLDHADISFPTPYGMITVNLKKGAEPVFSVPDGIVYEIV